MRMKLFLFVILVVTTSCTSVIDIDEQKSERAHVVMANETIGQICQIEIFLPTVLCSIVW